VPLNAHAEPLLFVFDGLDQAILGARRDPHARTGRPDTLVVQAIDWRWVRPECFAKACTGFDPQRVSTIGLGQAVGPRLRSVGRDVVDESAAADGRQ
jgi:hypothetical protein